MLNIKKLLAVMTCVLVSGSALSACKDEEDKSKSDGFTISEVDPSGNNNSGNGGNNPPANSDPTAGDREYEETLGVVGQEYEYYGLKYKVEKVTALDFEQYPDGKVLIVDLSLTNDSNYDYEVGAYANFEVTVDDSGDTTEFVTAQVMTIATRHFAEIDPNIQIFGIGGTPPIEPGDTLKGYLPIALTGEYADFEKVSIKFLPDNQAGVTSNITIDITPADVTN